MNSDRAAGRVTEKEDAMDKLMQDQRRDVKGFELIDFQDDADIERMRNMLSVDTPTTVNWNDWEYGSEVQELRALYEKGKRNQWNASDDIQWDQPVSKDEWLGDPIISMLSQTVKLLGKDEATQKAAMFDEMNYIVSQLLHGEQAALQICGQLTNECPTTDEKYYAAQQTADEARHAEVMARFLSEKMGTIYPVSPVTKDLLDRLLAAKGYHKKALGMQTLFEGIAMGILDLMSTNLQNPLFQDITQRVKIDEARHAAFGVLTMRRAVQEISEEDRAELEDWAFCILEALNANQQMAMMRVLGPKYGVDPDMFIEYVVKGENWAAMNSMLYMHTVMPNLKRLGLMTERTEAKYREVGIWFDAEAA